MKAFINSIGKGTLTWCLKSLLCATSQHSLIFTNKTYTLYYMWVNIKKNLKKNSYRVLRNLLCSHSRFNAYTCIKMPLDIKASLVAFLFGQENSTIKKQPGILSQSCLIKCEISGSPDGIFFYFKNRLYLDHLRETSQSQGSLIQFHGQGDKSLVGNKKQINKESM